MVGCFSWCTACAGLYVVCHSFLEAWPVEPPADQVQCPCLTKMSCTWVVMVVVDGLQPEVPLVQYIKLVLELECSIHQFPSFWLCGAVQLLEYVDGEWVQFHSLLDVLHELIGVHNPHLIRVRPLQCALSYLQLHVSTPLC